MGKLAGILLSALLAARAGAAQEATRAALEPLPEGNRGVASKCLGDAGIASVPGVVFAEDFEGGATRFGNHWGGIVLNPRPENVHTGKQALECTLPWPRPAKETGKGVNHAFPQGFDTLHLRYYAKFGKTTELYHGATHDGGAIMARAPGVPDAKPGIPADGRNEYTVLLDTWRPDDAVASPGTLAIYCYHPEQRHRWGEHFFPSGKTLPFGGSPAFFGPRFASRPDLVPDRDRWICYELMVKANTPGQRDGRIAIWLDGRLAADFPNLRLRDVDTLKANRVSLGLYTMNDAIRGPCSMWFDDVVVATSYLGPMVRRKPSGPALSAQEMARGREALGKGDLAAAWRHLEKVDSDDLLRDAQAILRRIEAIVKERIRTAQTLEATGDTADAVESYREIVGEFQGVPAAAAAKERMDALRKGPPKNGR